MNYRTTELLDEETGLTAGTKTIDINIKDIISRITLSWKVSRVGAGMDSYPHKDITKIELVDGSDVLFSLDGGQCQALCIYDRKCPTMNHGQHLADCSEQSFYAIDFGRYLWDALLALDPTRFNNLQLKVTYDHDVCDTGAASGALEIWAECFDEKVVTPIGFLMSKEFYSYTISSTGYTYVDLPTDHPIRKMLIQGYVAGYEPWYQIIAAKLDEDNGKRIPFDWDDLEDYFRLMKGVWTPVEEPIIGMADTAGVNYFYITPTDYYPHVAITPWGDDYVYFEGVRAGGKIRPYAHGADRQFHGVAHGYLPNHCFEFPFGDQKDMDDWYDVTKLGSLRLRLKGGTGASGTGAVVLQQLRKY